jgi:hypothetical protein
MLLVLSAFPAKAAESGGVFGQGHTFLSLMVGSGSAFNNNYFLIGAGATYYVIDGLGIGLSLENWSGGNPTMTKYTPYVQYVVYQASVVKPYLGAFYRHTDVSGLPGINSLGGRAGIYIPAGSSAFVGVGMVYESIVDCANSIYSPCTSTYPEISFTFAF